MNASAEKVQSDSGYGQKILMQATVYFEQKIWLNIQYNQEISFSICLEIHVSLTSSLMSMIDEERKWYYFSFWGIYGHNRNNWGKCLILFMTMLSIGPEWLSLPTLRFRINERVLINIGSENSVKYNKQGGLE